MFNIANLMIIGFLVYRTGGLKHRPAWPVVA